MLAVGLMLLSASPGGPTANLFSYLYKGDIALNITLTAINSVIAAFTLPLIVNFAIQHFMENGQNVGLQFSKNHTSFSYYFSACWDRDVNPSFCAAYG